MVNFHFQQLVHYDTELNLTIQNGISELIHRSRLRGYSMFGGYGRVARSDRHYWWIQSGDTVLFTELEAYLTVHKKEHDTRVLEKMGEFVE